MRQFYEDKFTIKEIKINNYKITVEKEKPLS